jgi:hypothetical protein
VVNVALPSIGRALGLSAAGLPWVVTAYMLMTGGLTLPGGALVMLGATGVLVATFFLGSLYLQDVLATSPVRAGLGFLPLVLVIGAGAHLASRLLGRAGSRLLAAAGLALMAGAAAGPGHRRGRVPGPTPRLPGPRVRHRAGPAGRLGDLPGRDRPGGAGFASGFLGTAHERGARGGSVHRDRGRGHGRCGDRRRVRARLPPGVYRGRRGGRRPGRHHLVAVPAVRLAPGTRARGPHGA